MSSRRNAPIRLTNKTAIKLRHTAQRVQTAGFLTAAALTIAWAVGAVVLGVRNLWAVVVMVLLAVLLDALIITMVRAAYFRLLGTAICTEAAARSLNAGHRERMRERQAAQDLRRIKRDTDEAERQAQKKRREEPGPGVISLDAKLSERRRSEEAAATDETQVMPPIGKAEKARESAAVPAKEEFAAGMTQVMQPVGKGARAMQATASVTPVKTATASMAPVKTATASMTPVTPAPSEAPERRRRRRAQTE